MYWVGARIPQRKDHFFGGGDLTAHYKIQGISGKLLSYLVGGSSSNAAHRSLLSSDLFLFAKTVVINWKSRGKLKEEEKEKKKKKNKKKNLFLT